MSEIKISAADVKKLRDQTGAGMMDCKKALNESGGNFDDAIAYLRKKGQKVANKRADREAKEGVVIAKVAGDNKTGIVIKLSSETDFVAKNQDFIDLADKIANIAITKMPESKEAMLALEFGEGMTVGDKVIERSGVIGEKIELANFETLKADMVVSYIHMGYKAGVVVGLNKASADFEQAGKDVAMQVAAMKPLAVDKDGIDSSVVEKEIEIGKEQARAQGKPEAMLEKIAMGKLGKFYKENTLMNQIFVKDGKATVAQYLQSLDKDLIVTDFKHVALG